MGAIKKLAAEFVKYVTPETEEQITAVHISKSLVEQYDYKSQAEIIKLVKKCVIRQRELDIENQEQYLKDLQDNLEELKQL